MKNISLKTVFFISKSLLWSLMLYTAVVLALDWEEMIKGLKPHNEVISVNNNPERYADKKMSVNEKVPKAIVCIWHHLLNISK